MALRLVTVFIAALSLTGRAPGQEMDEYQVKAAFLYNFAKFVEWPPESFKSAKDPVLVCVFGHNPFGNGLEEVIRGKTIEGRTFAFRQVSNAEQASACQILFVSSSDGRRFRTLAGSLKSAGILTVGESDGFALNGGVINFKLEDGRVRFQINVGAAEHARLHISSKLLGLAQIVKGDKVP
jgi:hypothetical protein